MEKTFYEISSSGTLLREGAYLDIQRSLVYRGERADFTPFLNVPLKELEKQLKASKAEEQKIYDQLKEAAEHGMSTGPRPFSWKKPSNISRSRRSSTLPMNGNSRRTAPGRSATWFTR